MKKQLQLPSHLKLLSTPQKSAMSLCNLKSEGISVQITMEKKYNELELHTMAICTLK